MGKEENESKQAHLVTVSFIFYVKGVITMKITYSQCGDYLIPDLVLSQEEQQPIGKYGRMRGRYLKEHRPVIYSNLLLSGRLNQHLAEIDQACMNRIELITQQMKVQEGVTEELKATDQMAWIARMNNIQNRAEEIVLHELIYA